MLNADLFYSSEQLNSQHPERIKFYLSKADTIATQGDRQRVLMQITQELCRRPGLNRAGFDMPTLFIPTLTDKVSLSLPLFLLSSLFHCLFSLCVSFLLSIISISLFPFHLSLSLLSSLSLPLSLFLSSLSIFPLSLTIIHQ